MWRKQAAFFDVDDTLIDLKSMFAFQAFWYANAEAHRGEDGTALYEAFRERLFTEASREDRAALNRAFYRSFAGRSCAEVRAIARAWFEAEIEERGDALWVSSACELVRRCAGAGAATVGVSGSSLEILEPIAEALGLDALLATRLEAVDGVFTGEIVPPQMIGTGKVESVHAFARDNNLDLGECVACGDHTSDLGMLRLAGKAYVVAGEPEMEAIARREGWTILPRGTAPAETAGLAHV
ncbi:MAG: HAD-IB family hydrolase [Azospirillaceae bacterium]